MVELSRSGPRRDQLVAAMIEIVAARGLESLTVREVARSCEVSIGTVQHYFATKDAMLVATFEAVVERIRARGAVVRLGTTLRDNLTLVLSELLPLDPVRAAEIRVQLAFSARACVTPDLAAIQQTILSEITDQLAVVFGALGRASPEARTAARLALATTDGLAQHAVSSGGLSPHEQLAALELLLDALG